MQRIFLIGLIGQSPDVKLRTAQRVLLANGKVSE